MPSIQPCPSCEKKIKVPDDAEGKKIRCPGCQLVVLITEDGLEAPKKSGVKSGAPARKRAVEDDDDDAPRSKRSSRDDDDEDDDAPRSKRASRDDDDDEDRPRKNKKKNRGGLPLWVWLASGGGLVAVIGLVLFLILSGGSKFSKINKGMAVKEVTDLLGEPPQGDTRFIGVWFYPSVSKEDAMNPAKMMSVKEICTVTFQNGKVSDVKVVKTADMMKGMGGF